MKALDKRHPDTDDAGDRPRADPKQSVYPVIKRLCEIVTPLVTVYLGDVCLERVLSIATRLYKFEVILLKDVLASKPSLLPPIFKMMLTEISEVLTDKIHSYLQEQGTSREQMSIMCAPAGLKRKKGSKGPPKSDKLSKTIPGLIYEMEQSQTQLIKLSAVLTLEKSFVSKLVKRSQVRDFRLKVKVVDQENRRGSNSDR